ncbi:MAG: YitT family protein [Firmicutes bacterium]|nr:YitT family protein [Bacillota bacterium]
MTILARLKRIRLPRFREVVGIALGCAVVALSLNLLLVPAQIAPGGVSGLAVVLYHLFGLPVSVVLLVVNIPLFVLSWFVQGSRFGINTLLGSLLLPLFVELTAGLSPVTGDLLLNGIYGGIVMGIGIGIVFRAHGSTGGTALTAQMLSKYTGFTVGQILLGIDFVVVALAGFVFDAELAMYALIALMVCTRVIDLVQQGLRNAKAAFIISANPRVIAQTIHEELQRGATILDGHGAWSGRELEVLLCVVNSAEITRLKTVISRIDPQAFVIVTDIQEVQGEGFSK